MKGGERLAAASSAAGRSAGVFGEPAPRGWLTSDPRFDLFAVVFAVATVHHELQFLLEQQLTGPLDQYMERMALLKATIGWPSAVGIGLHAACLVVSLLVLVLPWRRALLCLLAGPALLSQLASPERIPSHNSLMIAALSLVLIFGLAELIERWRQRGQGRPSPWLGWTIAGLVALVSITYFFSSFYKWNPVFFWPRSSPALEFATPYAALLGLPPQVALRLLAWPFILGTVLLELLLPVLLLWRRTRLAGTLVGLVFHLLMMGQGGNLSHKETVGNLTLFSKEVLPRLHELHERPLAMSAD